MSELTLALSGVPGAVGGEAIGGGEIAWADILNSPPSAGFGYSPTGPVAGESVSFTDESTDPDNNISSWSWDFGDGATSNKQNPSHTYGSGGAYTVTLTVTDDDGASDSTSSTLDVAATWEAVETFEDQDLAEYSGDKTKYGFTTNSFSGSYALEYTNELNNGERIISTSGLSRYPSAGDSIKSAVWRKTDGDSAPMLLFGVQDYDNYYGIGTESDHDQMLIFKRENGNISRLTQQFALDYSGWAIWQIDWGTDSSIRFRIFETDGSTIKTNSTDTALDISAADSTWTSGGIGFSHANGADGSFDDFTGNRFDDLAIKG